MHTQTHSYLSRNNDSNDDSECTITNIRDTRFEYFFFEFCQDLNILTMVMSSYRRQDRIVRIVDHPLVGEAKRKRERRRLQERIKT